VHNIRLQRAISATPARRSQQSPVEHKRMASSRCKPSNGRSSGQTSGVAGSDGRDLDPTSASPCIKAESYPLIKSFYPALGSIVEHERSGKKAALATADFCQGMPSHRSGSSRLHGPAQRSVWFCPSRRVLEIGVRSQRQAPPIAWSPPSDRSVTETLPMLHAVLQKDLAAKTTEFSIPTVRFGGDHV
jgi:hypothetical protein